MVRSCGQSKKVSEDSHCARGPTAVAAPHPPRAAAASLEGEPAVPMLELAKHTVGGGADNYTGAEGLRRTAGVHRASHQPRGPRGQRLQETGRAPPPREHFTVCRQSPGVATHGSRLFAHGHMAARGPPWTLAASGASPAPGGALRTTGRRVAPLNCISASQPHSRVRAQRRRAGTKAAHALGLRSSRGAARLPAAAAGARARGPRRPPPPRSGDQ